MKRYQITVKSGKVAIDRPDGTVAVLDSGSIVAEKDIAKGCLETLLRLKRAVEVPVEAQAAPPSVSGPAKAPEVQSKKK